jgi:hypothetical protein
MSTVLLKITALLQATSAVKIGLGKRGQTSSFFIFTPFPAPIFSTAACKYDRKLLYMLSGTAADCRRSKRQPGQQK